FHCPWISFPFVIIAIDKKINRSSLAQRLVCQTVHGAGLLALQSGQSPAELRDAITSPGGTTIAGLSELEARGFRAALWQAVMTSAKRSAELGSGINDPVKPVDDKESPQLFADSAASHAMRVGFIGAGRMAQAIAKGFTSKGVVKATDIWASAITEKTLTKVSTELGINVSQSNREVVEHSDILVLSVKPQVMDSVLAEMSDLVDPFKLVVSVAAGVTLDHLQSRLLPDSRVIRLMPNTPILVNAGASVYCVGKAAKPEDGPLIEALFKSVGTCDYLPENLMDAATGLSGSGPAFILEAIDAMSNAGVNLGLPQRKRRARHQRVTKQREVAEHSDILVLSVKPQVMDSVLAELSDLTDPSKLVVSVAAGVTLDHLQSRLLPDSRVIRLMPNTPILANAGASVYCVGKAAKPEDGPLIEALFKSVGTCDYLPENLMDAATGLSGSGPAFILEAIDAMTNAGVHQGLPRPLAMRLATQTVYGTGRLVLESGRHPAELRDAITSPGGTTITGLSELEARGFRTALWQAELGVNVSQSNREVVEHSDILVLSVKPQVMDSVLAELSDLTDPSKLVVSVAAGVTLDHLQSRLLPDSRVIRLMPNTPILANAGASVYCVGKAAKPEDGPLIEALFKSVGTCDYLPENLMDAATGLSGSGPAFILEAIDAMTNAGVHQGLPRPLAMRLATQTVYGTGRLVLESGRHPAELRDAITSPGGTTITGLSELEARGFRTALWQAVNAAANRSAELGAKKPTQ
uniref:Pyrroline-5-carboxylate reductase n=2 Tax=Macrostomum lignano TaxID=282301 RepID=A0A1I8H8P8_9PLAT